MIYINIIKIEYLFFIIFRKMNNKLLNKPIMSDMLAHTLYRILGYITININKYPRLFCLLYENNIKLISFDILKLLILFDIYTLDKQKNKYPDIFNLSTYKYIDTESNKNIIYDKYINKIKNQNIINIDVDDFNRELYSPLRGRNGSPAARQCPSGGAPASRPRLRGNLLFNKKIFLFFASQSRPRCRGAARRALASGRRAVASP